MYNLTNDSVVRSKMDTAVSQQLYAEAEQYRVRLKELAEEKTFASDKDSAGKVIHRKGLKGSYWVEDSIIG